MASQSRLTLILLAALAPWTVTAAPAAEDGVSPKVQPGDDFFGYANGAWLEATQLPAGQQRWGARNEIDAATKRQVAAVIQEAAAHPERGPATKAAQFYTAYRDEDAIDAKGVGPIAPLLQEIDALHSNTDLATWFGKHLLNDVDPLNLGTYSSSQLFGLAVEYGVHGEKNNFAYLLQGGLGLSDRDHYLSDAPAMQSARQHYQDYVARMLQLAKVDDAAKRAAAVIALETAVARTHATLEQSAIEQNADNHWTRADFATRAPGMDWTAFFAAAGLAQQQNFVVWQPTAVQGSAALIASQPLDAWKDYLRFHVLDRYADVLPRSIMDVALAYRFGETGGTATRTQRAIEATDKALPHIVGQLYVAKYFPAATRTRVQTVVENVRVALRARLDKLAWMSPASKAIAREKLETMYFGVGYPDTWPDDSRLLIDSRDAFGNARRVEAWNYQNALDKLGRPVDRKEWMIPPQHAVAVLNFLQNSYNFSAALLQPPKFDASAGDAAAYGAIGAIIGHEISHFVDTLGAQYDPQGATKTWWTAADKTSYETASQPLIEQFSDYHAFPDLAIDGKLTFSENAADHAGLVAAFDAYRRALGSKVNDKERVRQQDRQFFLAFARAYRVKVSDDALRKQAMSNDHAPERFRAATVRNLDAWYDAFDVKPGQRLYLAPEARVRIW
jgi:putative endopeptidase